VGKGKGGKGKNKQTPTNEIESTRNAYSCPVLSHFSAFEIRGAGEERKREGGEKKKEEERSCLDPLRLRRVPRRLKRALYD